MDQAEQQRAFLGVGWHFPPGVDPDGRTATVAYEEDIRQAIHIILGTDRGERVMRPDFGAGLHSFVFEPVNQTTLQRVKTRVEEALVEWEPRVDVEQVLVKPDRRDRSGASVLLIEVTYRVRATNTLHNLVYPFYLQEGSSL